jgi:hypothetical protein
MGPALTAILAFAAVAQPAKPTTAERLAEHVKDMVKESRAPAEQALKQLAQLVNMENFKTLGFDTLEEVKDAELGRPLPIIMVRLDELREYKKGDDPYKLLHPIPKVMYAVNVKGATRCGVEVQKRDGKWESSSFGIAGPARHYADAVKKQAMEESAASLFIIKVPALNQTYLAYQTERGEARLIEVSQQVEANQKVEARPAADVLAELVKEAREHDGSLR